MTDPFVAEIRMVPFNFAPRGWAFCDGQLMPISQNTALFSLLGTNYGGDGRSTFALPDLQGAAPMHWGDGPGLSSRQIGETGGSQAVTLLATEIPSHAHALTASGDDASTSSPVGAVPALASASQYRPDADTAMAPGTLAPAGGGQPHNTMQPYLTLNFVIALQGVFPPRQ
jgi:microcystin-dependent protein